jgi:acetyl-CoA/propionyl-CoA carboxylase biotin carboxyl carrier protein
MLRALEEYEIDGVKTLLGFHRALLAHPCFVQGETCAGIVESDELAEQAQQLLSHETTVAAGSDGILDGTRQRPRARVVELDGRRFEVTLFEPEPPWAALARARGERRRGGGTGLASVDAVVSPMQGTVLAVEVADGEAVVAGQVLCVVEAMKMENEVRAHRDGVVAELSVAPGESVSAGQMLCVVRPE